MKTTKVNNVKIKPIITDSHPIEKIGGFKLFPEPYCNVAIIAKKKKRKDKCFKFLFGKVCRQKYSCLVIFFNNS